MGAPGDGKLTVDGTSTVLCISTLDGGGADVSVDLAALDVGDEALLQLRADAAQYVRFSLVAAPLDHVTWYELAVAVDDEGATRPNPNADVFLNVIRPDTSGARSPYATVADLAAALHIRVTPDNTDALERALNAAATEIDADLDRYDPMPDPVPDAIVQANIALAVEAYKLPDAAFGVLGFDGTGVVRAAKDSLPRYWSLLTPYKQWWGIA